MLSKGNRGNKTFYRLLQFPTELGARGVFPWCCVKEGSLCTLLSASLCLSRTMARDTVCFLTPATGLSEPLESAKKAPKVRLQLL